MELAAMVRQHLLEKGASTVGFVEPAVRNGYPVGIAIGVALDRNIVRGISHGPTTDYYEEYKRANNILDGLDETVAALLRSLGYGAAARTRAVVKQDHGTLSSVLPYKTVATRAGLGWIGKCALLVTEQFGSAIRLSAVLTDAPLHTAEPVTASRCGSCGVCRENCPGGAVQGENWRAGLDRASLFDAFACHREAQALSGQIGIDESLCGRCIGSCPWTQRYLSKLRT